MEPLEFAPEIDRIPAVLREEVIVWVLCKAKHTRILFTTV